jgi:hypothetical protein
MTTIQELETLFDDHPSLDASLADFEPGSSELGHSPQFPFRQNQLSPSPGIGQLYPSHHSGFLSNDNDDSEPESNPSHSGGGYSPPAWRRAKNGVRSSGFWDRNDMVASRGNSRESSPEYESADDGEGVLAMASRTRLPTGSLSPEKRRSPSPDPYPTGGGDFRNTFGGNAIKEEEGVGSPAHENSNNCRYYLSNLSVMIQFCQPST